MHINITVGGIVEYSLLCFASFTFRYGSELRLVRLKMSEGGVYTFQASNGDASVNHTFTIFVTSKSSYGFLQKGVLFPPAT